MVSISRRSAAMSAAALRESARLGAVAVEEVVRFCKGEQQENVVTREMLATMT